VTTPTSPPSASVAHRVVRACVSRLPRGGARTARLLRRVLRRPFVDTVEPSDLGVRLTIDPADVFQLEMWLGAYQPHVVSFLRHAVKPGASVLCAGLHIGYIATLARKLAGPRGLVMSAEPDTAARTQAIANLALNDAEGLAPIRVFAGGLSDAHGERNLYRSSTLGHSSFAAPHQPLTTETVPLVSGDDWLASLGVRRLDVLVLDVEGWELHVLRGLESVVARSPNLALLVEVSEWSMREAGHTPTELFDFLRRHGFSMQWASKADRSARLGVSGPRFGETATAEGDLLCTR
jgi:FkbM family methyltransferase